MLHHKKLLSFDRRLSKKFYFPKKSYIDRELLFLMLPFLYFPRVVAVITVFYKTNCVTKTTNLTLKRLTSILKIYHISRSVAQTILS